MLLTLMSRKRMASIALILALGATGVACEGDVDVEDDGGGGEEGGGVEGELDVEGGEGEEGGD